MKSLKALCEPRDSVFDKSRRDTVLNLTHLMTGKIDAKSFFEENYVTDGMKTLLTEAFRRLAGKSEQAVFKLTQAMGGGKTHSLISLGLIAQHPELRLAVLPGLPNAQEVPSVRLVAFSGRETDVAHGVWGEIAKQVGKFDAFNEYYSPLKAPGPTAWINLLKGPTPTLILLDELPPYLDNARSMAVGSSDLARVTSTALTNLFEAVAESELSNVCVVLTDLVGTYAEASAQIAATLKQLQDEAQRHSMNLTPVQINTDEFYQILRKRLFKKLPGENDIGDVAQGYAKAVREAKQMDITAQSPETFAQLIQLSYPFHPAIKDLYARFRENSGFQQTRALIRLMRIIASRMWHGGEADKRFLISVHDVDFNDAETLSEIRQINPTLENAISHDIAGGGTAVAEVMDANLTGSDTRDACRLIFMSSLSNVPGPTIGLSMPEIVAYLCSPGRNLAKLKSDVLEKLSTAAWYLHSTRDGKLFFKNVENLNAKLEGLAKAYVRETAIKDLRAQLTNLFSPTSNYCYQDILPLPAMDEIQLSADRTVLVISEPFPGQGLNPELRKFWDQDSFKNRIAVLTGSRATFDNLIDSAKRLKAIKQIIEEMKADGASPADPQFKQADELQDRIHGQFLSAVKETFSTLFYPTRSGTVDELKAADFLMNFKDNKYNGEQQVIDVLKDKQKFTDDVTNETFRKKVEARIFTTNIMLWSEVKKRAAMNPQWQWHRRDALDALKDDLVRKEIWREDGGGYVDRSPPPPKTTAVQFREGVRDDDTGEVELKITAVNGDTLYTEVGGEATTASFKVDNGSSRTSEMEVSFLAVDSTGVHPSGAAVTWKNKVSLKYAIATAGAGKKTITLIAAPNTDGKAEIRYSTDGSDPKVAGGTYNGPFTVTKPAPMVLAIASRDGVKSDVLTIPLDWGKESAEKPIRPDVPLIWKRKLEYHITAESYKLLEDLKQAEVSVSGVRISVADERWAELTMHDKIELSPIDLYEGVEAVRKLFSAGQLGIEVGALHFTTGQGFLDWCHAHNVEAKGTEVIQS